MASSLGPAGTADVTATLLLRLLCGVDDLFGGLWINAVHLPDPAIAVVFDELVQPLDRVEVDLRQIFFARQIQVVEFTVADVQLLALQLKAGFAIFVGLHDELRRIDISSLPSALACTAASLHQMFFGETAFHRDNATMLVDRARNPGAGLWLYFNISSLHGSSILCGVERVFGVESRTAE